MKEKLILLLAVLLVFVAHPSFAQYQECYYDGSINVASQQSAIISTFLNGSYEATSGILTVCFNGTYLNLCGSGDSVIDRDEIAEITCRSLGYYDGHQLYETASNDNPYVIDHINCSSSFYYSSLQDCSIDITNDCTSNLILGVACIKFIPNPYFCTNDGDTRLGNISTFSFSNMAQITVGVPQICYGNLYQPLCSSTVDQNVANYFCRFYNGQAIPYPLIGDLNTYNLVDYTYGSYFTNVSCPDGITNLTDCYTDVSTSCPSRYNGVVSCTSVVQECYVGAMRGVNQVTETYNVRSSTRFRVQICSGDGNFVDFCSDDVNATRIARLACDNVGYQYGNASVYSDVSYQFGNSNGLYAANVSCEYDYIGSCTFNVTDTCSGSSLVVECSRICDEGDARIFNGAISQLSNGTLAYTGILEVCINGNWATICYDGSNLTDFTLNAIRSACSSLGYTGGSVLLYNATFGHSQANQVLIDVECPYYLMSFADCSYNISDNQTCTSHDNDALLQCVAANRTCYSFGSVSLFGQSRISFSNGTTFIVGYPAVCALSDYSAAICSVAIGPSEADEICRFSYYQSGYSFALYGESIDYFPLLTDSGVYNYNCTGGFYDCTFNYTTANGCQSNGGPALITCQQDSVCSEGQVRLVNQGYGTFSNGSSVSVGRPEICINGSYAPVCQAALNEELLEYLCYNHNYRSNVYVYPYPIVGSYLNYGTSSNANLVLTYLNCTTDSFLYSSCNFNDIRTNNDSCNSYGGDGIISCTTISRTASPPPLVCSTGQYTINFQTTFNSGGIEVFIGYLSICVNGTYYGVCANETFANIDNATASLICNDLGYTLYATLQSLGGPPATSAVIDTITCPANTMNLSLCNFGLVNTGECATHSYDAYISCARSVQPNCTTGAVRLFAGGNNSYFSSNSLVEQRYGLLEICVDGVYRHVCGHTNASVNTTDIVRTACNQLGYSQSSFYAISVFNDDVIDSVTCPYVGAPLSLCTYNTTSDSICNSEVYISCSRTTQPNCTTGAVRLFAGSNYSYFSSNSLVEQYYGFLQICVDGVYRHVCGHTNASVNATDIVRTACNQLGYSQSSFYTSSISNDDVIDSVTCPYVGAPLSLCTYNTTSDGVCNNSYSDIYAQCRRSTPACTQIYALRNTSYFNFVNGTSVTTGRVEVCIGNRFYPVCTNGLNSTGSLNSDNVNGVCVNALSDSSYVYYPDQYIGLPSDYYVYEYEVITNITCPPGATSYLSCYYTTGYGGCYENGGQAVISCLRPTVVSSSCSSGSISLSNFTRYNAPFGSSFAIGRVEACSNNVLVTVCDDTAYADYFAQQACLSYSNYSIVSYDDIYADALSNRSLILNSCNYMLQYSYDWLYYCNYTINRGQCASRPLTVRCETECGSYGNIRLTQPTTNYYSNGTTGITGNAEFCRDGQWNSICNGSLDQYGVNVFCRQLGYQNGTVVFYNPGGMSDTNRFVNLSCPSYQYYGISSCNVNGQCNSSSNTVVHCYDGIVDTCYSNQVRFGDYYYGQSYVTGQFPNGTTYSIGNVEVCINGTYADVCNETLTAEQARWLCLAIDSSYTVGYPYPLYNNGEQIGYDSNNYGLFNIFCPPDPSYPDLSSCAFNITSGSGCSAYGGPAVITCARVPEVQNCSNLNSLRLDDQGYGSFNNGTSFVIGRPQYCQYGSYIPFCTPFDQNDALTFCVSLRSDYGARPYPIIGTSSDFGISTVASTVISNLSCPVNSDYNFFSCSQETSVSSGGCYGFANEDAAITCINRPRPCPQFQSSLSYVGTEYNTNSYVYIYQVALCINNVYGDICADGITDQIANLICIGNGANSGTVDRGYNNTYSYYSASYSGLTCPYDATSLSSCNANITSVSSCFGYGGILVVRCTHVIDRRCPSSTISLSNAVNFTVGTDSYIVGRPTVCVDGVFHPICNATSLGMNETSTICLYSGYPYSSSVIPGLIPAGITVPPLSNTTNTSNVVTSYECTYPFDCNTTVSNDSTCSSYGGGYAAVLCRRACRDGQYTLFNNFTTVINGTNVTIGIPQGCFNGVITALCADGTNSPNTPEYVCNLLGFEGGIALPSNSTLYGNSPLQETIYYNNFSCPYYYTSIDDCNAGIATDPTCYSGELDYIVACYGQRVLFPSSTEFMHTETSMPTVSLSVAPTTTVSVLPSSSVAPTTTVSVLTSSSVAPTTTVSVLTSSSVAPTTTVSVLTSSSVAPTTTVSVLTSSSVAPTTTVSVQSTTPSPTVVLCSSYDGQFGNRSSFRFGSNAAYYTGRIEVCANGQYLPVCRQALSTTFTRAFCNRQGYGSEPVDSVLIGTLRDYTDGFTTQYAITNTSCYSSELYSCSYQVNETNCSAFGGISVISCQAVPSSVECSGDSFQLLNTTDVTYYTSASSTTGRLSVCRNNEYVDICADGITNISNIASSLCYYRHYSGSTYDIVPWSSQYGTSNSTVVLTDVNCYYSSLSSCTYNVSDISQCSSNNIVVVRCERECNNNEVRLVDEGVTFLPDGNSYVSGYLQLCVNNRWTPVCNDGSLTDILANIACQDIDYQLTNGTFLSNNDTNNDTSITAGVSCNNYSTSLYDCGITVRNSSECSYAVLQCLKYNNCSNYYYYDRVSFAATVTTSAGIRARIGRYEECVNGRLASYCNSTLDSSIIDRVCTDYRLRTGLAYPIVGTEEDYGVNLIRNVITSISCPVTGTTIDNCNLTTGTTCNGSTNIITCFDGPYSCSIYSPSLRSPGSGMIDNVQFITGYAEICVGYTYIPICRDGISNESLRYVCTQHYGYYDYFIGPLVGVPMNYTLSTSDTVATNVSCPVFSRDYGCRFTVGDTCENRGGFVLLTCRETYRMCDHGDVRIVDGPNNYTGRVEFCYFGTWRTICGTGFSQADAALSCGLAGFNHDLAVNLSAGSYGSNDLPPVLAGLQCMTGLEGSFSNCTPINGALLMNCNSTLAAAVSCEPVIVSLNTTVNGTAIFGLPTNASITCNANFDQLSRTNYTLNSINWYHNGQVIMNIPNRYNITQTYLIQQRCYYVYNNGSYQYICGNETVGVRLVLEFETLAISDGGEYTCIVNITDGNYSRTVTNRTTQLLNIQVPTQSVTVLQNITLLSDANNNATFTCSFLSSPSPIIQWYFVPFGGNPVAITTGGKYNIYSTYNDSYYVYTSTLTVYNVVFSNAGVYRCNGNDVSSEAVLLVFVSPTVTVSGMINITETNEIVLSCIAANSYPQTSVTWLRNNQLLVPSSAVLISTSVTVDTFTGLYTVNSTLRMLSAKPFDSGRYTCRTSAIPISNPVLQPVSDSIDVVVTERNDCIVDQNNQHLTPCLNNGVCIDEIDAYYCECPNGFIGSNCETPVASDFAPMFIMEPSDQNVTFGSLINLTCIVTGSPQPIISWFKDGQQISNITTPFYIIPSIQTTDRGQYYCRASNSLQTITSREALVIIRDIRQYVSVLTLTGSRRKREIPMQVMSLLNDVRQQYVGSELSPGVYVADISILPSSTPLAYQIIFTIRFAAADSGPINAVGVTSVLSSTLNEIADNNPSFSFSPVIRFDGCVPDDTNLNGGLTIAWPEASIQESVLIGCPCGSIIMSYGAVATRTCFGNFSSAGTWGTPNDTQCTFDTLTTEFCELSDINDTAVLSSQLNNATSEPELLDAVDVGITGVLLSNLLPEAATVPEIRESYLNIIDNMVSVSESALMRSQESTRGSQRILDLVENFAATVAFTGDTLMLNRSMFSVQVKRVSSSSYDGEVITGSSDVDQEMASVTIPSDIFSNIGYNGTARLTVSEYISSSLFQPVNSPMNSRMSVQTPVLSCTIYNNNGNKLIVQNLLNPVTFNFTSSKNLDGSICAFWNETDLEWSTNGVSTVTHNSNLAVCISQHLSSFALVSPLSLPSPTPSATPTSSPASSQTPSPTPSLTSSPTPSSSLLYKPEPILFAGLVISLVFVLLTTLSHLLSVSQRHCPEGRVFIASNITLFVLYVLFIVATAATYATGLPGFCGTFSGLFHYASLVYFMWLLIEAMFYSIKLHMGIGSNTFTRHYFSLMLLINLIISAIIVIISAGVGYNYYASTDAFCRPQMFPFYYGYVLPVGILYILTWVFYCFGFCLIYCSDMTSSEKQFRRDSVVPHFYVGIVLLIIFSIVWVFGLSATEESVTGTPSTALQYLFSFLAIAHSVVLFVLSLVRTQDTRAGWISCLNCITRRKGKYDFVSRSSQRKGTNEVYGLDESGKYLTDTNTGTMEEKQPLSDIDDGQEEPRYVTTNLIEEEKKESTVVVNESALQDADDDDHKKTDL